MASSRQNPASPSDPPADVPLAVRVRRQAATGPAGQPGTIRVVAIAATTSTRSEGTRALAACRSSWASRSAAVWVDLVAPTPAQAKQVGEALGLHPLIIEDVLEGNQRAKIETTDGVVHIVLFHLTLRRRRPRVRARRRARARASC